MRRKPITRDEIRFDGSRITTLPIDSVRKNRQCDYDPIPKLWVPLLRSLSRAQKKRITAPCPYRWASPIEHECRQCHHRFYRTSDGSRTYCSDHCAAAAHSATVAKARSEARAAARADRKCAHCGKPIKAQRSTMRFCSVRCRVAAHRNGGI